MQDVPAERRQDAREFRQREPARRHRHLERRILQIVLDGAVDRHLALRRLQRQLFHVDAIVALAEAAAQLLERQVRACRAHRQVVERQAVVHGLVQEPRLHIQPGDLLRQRVAAGRRAIVDEDLPVLDLHVGHRDRTSRSLSIRLLPLPLRQPCDVPALTIAREIHRWIHQRDPLDDDAARDDLRSAVPQLHLRERDDVLPVHVDADVAQLDPVEQIAAELPDRELAVQILVPFPHDVPAQPLVKPRRLRHDQRERDDPDQDREHERQHAQRPPEVPHGRGPSTLQQL